jgi:hypothetical protein
VATSTSGSEPAALTLPGLQRQHPQWAIWRAVSGALLARPADALPAAGALFRTATAQHMHDLITRHTWPSAGAARRSADHSSAACKRALRRLAREQPAAYAAFYERIRPATPGHYHARNKAWTQLRHQYPGRYQELYDQERRHSPPEAVPAGDSLACVPGSPDARGAATDLGSAQPGTFEEQGLAGHKSQGHADSVTADCPVRCLRAVVSAHAFEPLRLACLSWSDTPRTVGDVMRLHQQGRLSEIRNLGPRRIGEIEICLILAGLLTGQPTGHGHARD